jgi:hypothetical protein
VAIAIRPTRFNERLVVVLEDYNYTPSDVGTHHHVRP